MLLTGSNDHTMKVWNISRDDTQSKTTPVKTFRGHGGWVRNCVWVRGPEGERILSVSHDETAKLWNPGQDATAELELVNDSALDAVAFSKNSKEFATASRDKTARIYRLDDKDRIQSEQILAEGHDNLITAGVYFDKSKKLATAGFDGTARVWDVTARTELLKLKAVGQSGAIAVSPNDGWILTSSDNKQSEISKPGYQPWKAKLWNATTGELAATFGEHGSEVTAVAFANRVNDDGSWTLATADAGGHIVLWNWSPRIKAEPTRVANLEFKNSKEHKAHNARVVALRFLPDDGRLLSAGHKTVAQWDLSTNKEVDRLRLLHPKVVRSMDLTADGKWLVTTCFDDKLPGLIRLWDLEREQVEPRTFRPEGQVRTLMANLQSQFAAKKTPNEKLKEAFMVFYPNASDADYMEFVNRGGWKQGVEQLVSKIPDRLTESTETELVQKLARLFADLKADDLLLAQTNSVAISPDGRYIAATNRVDRITYVWRPSADRPIILQDGLEVWAAAFSPEQGRTELAVFGMSDARLWKQLDNAEVGKIYSDPTIALNAQGEVASIGFSPDGKYFVTAGQDGAARVWNVETEKDVAKLQGIHKETINAAAYSPGGEFILTVSNDDPAHDDETMVLWKLTPNGVDNFQVAPVRTFRGHTNDVLDAAFSPDGKWIVSVSRDKTIRVWNAETGDQACQTQQVDPESETRLVEEPLCVAFANDGNRILDRFRGKPCRHVGIENHRGQTRFPGTQADFEGPFRPHHRCGLFASRKGKRLEQR